MSEQLEQERSRIQEADDTIRQLQDALAKARARMDQAEDRSIRLNRDLCVIYHLADIPTAGDVVEAVAALKRQRDEAQEEAHQLRRQLKQAKDEAYLERWRREEAERLETGRASVWDLPLCCVYG